MKTVTTNQVETLLAVPHMVVIDVVDPELFKRAHIPGSRNAPVREADFLSRVGSLVKGRDTTIVVYAPTAGARVLRTAAKALSRAGYTEVFAYEGGLRDWIAAGKDVERG
jgi:rhodanese-related sulfurtransferase